MPTAYVTAPPDAADDLARAVVEEGLAACVNRVECLSTYRWDGEVVTDDGEEILFVKTTDDGYAELAARIEELHPYDVPCIERFDGTAVHQPFAEWIHDNVE